jgi:hypothetical protein
VAHCAGAVPDDEFQFGIVLAFALLKFTNDKMPVMARRIVVQQIRRAGTLRCPIRRQDGKKVPRHWCTPPIVDRARLAMMHAWQWFHFHSPDVASAGGKPQREASSQFWAGHCAVAGVRSGREAKGGRSSESTLSVLE